MRLGRKPFALGLLVLALLLGQLIGLRSGQSASTAHASAPSVPVVNAADTATPTITSTPITLPTNTTSPTLTTVPPTASFTPGTPTATLVPTITGTALPGPRLVIINPATGQSNGPPGTTVTISVPLGYFPPNTAVTVYFTDPLAGSPQVLIATGTTGSDSSLTLTNVALPPSATPGVATITVTTSASISLSGPFTILSSVTVSPPVAPPGATIVVTGDGFAPQNTIAFKLGNADITPTNAPVKTDRLGHFTATFVIPASQPLGTAGIYATDVVHTAVGTFLVGTPVATATITSTATLTDVPGTPTLLPTAPPRHSVTPIAIRPTLSPTPVVLIGPIVTSAYFAEGYTGTAKANGRANFAETLTIANTNGVAAAVAITYYIQGKATPLIVSRAVPAGHTLVESVNTDVGPDRLVSAVVTSPQRVHVVRTISRTAPDGARLDGSTTQPAVAPSTSWSFAEGYTGVTFQEYLTLLNPGSKPASVSIRLAPQAATAARARTLTLIVPALSRATANIRSLNAGDSAQSVGMIITATQAVVAERVEYFGDGDGSGKFGSTVSSGLPTPGTQLRIGYGLSGGTSSIGGRVQPAGDQEYITLLNPSTAGGSAHVTIGFSDALSRALGQPVTVDVAPGTRRTVIANTVTGSRAAGPFVVSLSVSGGAGIQAEAAQYYGGSPNIGRHPGIALPALTSPSVDLFLSDLSTKLLDGTAVARSVYLYNPLGAADTVAATYYSPSGAMAHATYTIPAGGLTAIDVGRETQRSIAAGSISAEFRLTGGGSFAAYAVGRTPDNRAAYEEVGAPAS